MKGILFKPWKIQFIAEHPDMEIMTRRVIKPQPIDAGWAGLVRKYEFGTYPHGHRLHGWFRQSALPEVARYQQGEAVYIKEAWRAKPLYGNYRIEYKLDNSLKPLYVTEKHDCWLYEPTIDYRTPLFMPEWAARHFIVITGVRAERLQEITGADALAEGVEPCRYKGYTESYAKNDYMVGHFATLWDSINKDYPWESNPWVFPYTFRLGEK